MSTSQNLILFETFFLKPSPFKYLCFLALVFFIQEGEPGDFR